jgi:ubiquinone/menaquinone biosynthesis C-methylase UbiE
VAGRGRAPLTAEPAAGPPPVPSPADALAHVREGYDRWAHVYDHDGNPLVGLEDPAMRAAVGDARDLATLDLGCGTGRHAGWLAAAGALVTAADFSRGMLAEARRKPGAEQVRFLACDLRRPLPFADGAFHLVVSGLVLEHVPDLDHFFGEVRRVVRAGGRAVVSAMHPAMFERGAQARFTDPDSGEVVRPGSVPHQVEDFLAAARRAGFAVDGVTESAADAAVAERYPRAARYVGWPMLVVLRLRAAERPGAAAVR